MSEQWNIGDRIGDRYRISSIKKGGMGIVFICYDQVEDRIVAIKTYQDRFLKDNASVERFIAEATTWITIGKHRNIVRAYYVPLYMFRPYIIMEYIEGHEAYGSDLATWMARRRLPLITILDFAIQFCSGMIHAEKAFASCSKTFVHRDIKPSNIMITSNAVIKITDFGISRSLSEKDQGTGWGTPRYMSPEQIDDPLRVDTRSDIFSFGRVLEEIAAPLDAQDSPEALGRCIHICLEKKPKDRFQDFSQLKEWLLTIYSNTMGQHYEEPDTSEPGTDSKEELLRKSVSFINLWRPDEAIQCCDQCLSIQGSQELDYKALCFRGSALVDKEERDAALTEYAKAIALFPDMPFAYTMRANIFNDTGRLQEAIADYNRAIELDREYDIAYYNRGLCRLRMGLLDDALNDFNQAITLGFIEAHLNRGRIYFDKHQYDEALADFKKAVEINPRDASSYANIAVIYEEYGKLEEALEYYNMSIQVNPYYLPAYYHRGVLFGKKLKLPQEAIGDFEMVLRLDPKECEKLSSGFLKFTEEELNRIYYNTYRDCGLSYYLLEQWDKAKYYFKKYLEFPALQKDTSDVVERIYATVLWLETKT